MNVTSRDGTPIAFDVQGDGPALILVDGALTTRRSESRPELLALLAPQFTVYSYDRRGRGESGDTRPYAVDREIDDIDALIVRAGGRAYLNGHSSGACLALEAARALGGRKVAGVGAYEAPWNDDPARQGPWSAYLRELAETLRDGRRGDAVALFMEFLGTPAEQIAGMRGSPHWSNFEAIAPTLAYDHAAVMGPRTAVPREMLAGVTAPVLALCGSASFPFMCATARTISEAVPHGRSANARRADARRAASRPGARADRLLRRGAGKAGGLRGSAYAASTSPLSFSTASTRQMKSRNAFM